MANFAGVTLDSSGNLFGVTPDGGTGGNGSVFEVNGSTHAVSTVVSFNASGSEGSLPSASLTLGPDGNLYGTTIGGGVFGDGTVFEFNILTHAAASVAGFL